MESENIIFLFIMIFCSALFTGIGIYAMHRKEPMWFWSGSKVESEEISDVPAYNMNTADKNEQLGRTG